MSNQGLITNSFSAVLGGRRGMMDRSFLEMSMKFKVLMLLLYRQLCGLAFAQNSSDK